MNVSTGLLDYLPLPQMPFNKIKPTESVTKQEIVEASKTAIDKKADKYRYEDAYAYHPHNGNKMYPRQGRNVDFVVA
tara:strand:- start:21 stop:251 length:231 start_codon:yes stop_codon:yes gene_type:complete